MYILRAIFAIIRRDFRYMFFQRTMLLSAIVRSLLWMLVIGGGFSTIWQGESNYFTFLFPGLLAMSMLFAGILSTLMLVQDNEKGILQLFLLAPIQRSVLLLSRIISAFLIAIFHAIIVGSILLLLLPIHIHINPVFFTFCLLLLAVFTATLGCFFAVIMPRLVNFSVAVNFIIFPLFFLSGALYPLDRLPQALYYLANLNPFTHGVQLLQVATGILSIETSSIISSILIVCICTAILFISSLYCLIRKYNF